MKEQKALITMLSGNALKIIAAICMLVDHIGLLIFPELKIMRIIGRIAFPIFAYMIAEGCEHTRSKLRYFGTIFTLAIVFQIVYYIICRDMYLNILFTFSLSVITIFALQYFKKKQNVSAALLFELVVIIVYALNRKLNIDYGFWGCMTPVFASLLRDVKKLDKRVIHIAMTAICLVILALEYRGVQMYALLSIPLLLLYSGKRGKWQMKYFFYIFYPAHLVIIYGIAMLIN